MKNIVLIGLSGSGKSTLGKQLAQRLNRTFVDLDDSVCKASGRSIPQLFAEFGEEHFRDWESQAVSHAAAQNGQVIATGGGAVLRQQNADQLRETGFVVYLDRPVEQILQDIQTSARPLLQQGADKLHAMDSQRRPIYEATAHLILENTGDEARALQLLETACLPLMTDGYAVIGEPIGHSLSPPIYRAAFDHMGIPAPYTTMRVPRGTLPAFVAGVRSSEMKGFNITIPHKRDILPLLDGVSREAALCGAVNTVLHRDGALHGFNTDMEGLHLSLKQSGHGYSGRRVLVIGAGGAARAVALKAALENAAALHIAARDVAAAQALAQQVQQATQLPCQYGSMQPKDLENASAGSDVLINCTPLGMQGIKETFSSLSFIEHLPPHALVCDLIYKPAQTHLLAAAKARGLATLNGLGMLIYQAILAMEIYLDKPLPHQELYAVIHNTLSENKEAAL